MHIRAVVGAFALVASGNLMAQDMSVPEDPVAAIEGDWEGIWDEWTATVSNGRVTLTKGDSDTYTWLPVGTVLGVLNNSGKTETRTFRFSGSTCLDHRRDLPPSQYKTIPCGDYGAVLVVNTNSYTMNVSGISLQKKRGAAAKAAAAAKPDREAKAPKQADASPKESSKPAPEGPSASEQAAERHSAVEQRNREKQAKYEAEMKAWQAGIDAQKAEEERKKAKFEADKQAAAQSLSAFESEQATHRRQVEAHAQLVFENQAAQQRHARCMAGERSACVASAPGKLAEVKDAGDASTDTDARQCVTQPVLSPNEAFKGSIKAVVINGCEKPVDVKICLMRTGGWNCGMTLGLKPQDNWTWWTMQPQDGVFWDARTSGTNRALGKPAGA